MFFALVVGSYVPASSHCIDVIWWTALKLFSHKQLRKVFDTLTLCDQDPLATDVLLDVTVPFSGGGSPAYLVIDKLPDCWGSGI